jgi:two-component system NarL family sensor kinase
MSDQEGQLITIIISGVFFAGLMSTFVIAIVVLHRQRQVQNRQKLDYLKSEYEKTLLNIENEIQQETLNHIGRELHDNVGQLLSVAKLNFSSQKAGKHIEGIEVLNQIIQEVRNLSKKLNLDWVESITIEEFLIQQLKKIRDTGFCETLLESDILLEELDKEQKLVLIRVIQESLNNAIKHASPDRIEIRTIQQGADKKIQIKDNGKGFDTAVRSTGSGMHNLKKRMETIGGKFELKSEIGKGTEINLTLPK